MVVQEFTLANSYGVDLIKIDITPDPTVAGAQPGQYADPWAVNLITLRSAIMMISNDLKLAANSAWYIKDVHMSVDMRELHKANKIILDEAKEAYENLRMQYCVGAHPNVQAVLTPINLIFAGYRAPMYPGTYRDRFMY
jgi:hypothetical protein